MMKYGLIILMGVLLSAQVLADDDSKERPAPSNDVIYRVYADDPNTINPIISSDTVSEEFQRYVVDSLAMRDIFNPDKWAPQLAEKWEQKENADGSVEIHVWLRKGVKWHSAKLPDGKDIPAKEVDSRDIKFTFDLILNPVVDCQSLRSYYDYFDSIKVDGKYELTFKWKKPYFMLFEFSMGVGIVPKHVYSINEKGDLIAGGDATSKEFGEAFNKHWFNDKLCGTGPFMFVDWKKNDSVTLVRNEDYWGSKPFFKKMVYRCIPNPQASYQELLAANVDSVGLTPSQYDDIATRDEFKQNKVVRIMYDYPAYRYVGWNAQKPMFADKKVRHALSNAIPRQKIIDSVFKGRAQICNGPFLPWSSSTSPNVKGKDYDPDSSRKLLAEAGWKDTDGDGVLDKLVEGSKVSFKFEMIIFANSPEFENAARIIQDDYKKLGIEMSIVPTKWELFLEKTKNREFDACILGWAMGWTDDPQQIWHSTEADKPGSSNYVSYRNKDVDALIEKLHFTVDQTKQKDIYNKIHEIIFEEQPYTFLWTEKRLAAYNVRIKNAKFTGKVRPCFWVLDWWADPVREK